MSADWGIAEVERDTGLGKDTLRVWERRYGFPQPVRDERGERRYDEGQLLRLRLIRRLLDAGHRPAQVVPRPLEELQGLLGEPPSGRRPKARAAQVAAGRPLLDPAWLAMVREHRLDELRQGLLQQQRVLGLVAWLEQLVSPLAAAVGEAWAAGTLSVYQEHLFTDTTEAVLRETCTALAAGPSAQPRSPRVLLTTLPGELHTLGLLMAQAVLAMQRCETVMLGPNTPLAEVAEAVARLQIDVVALGTSAHAQARSLRPELERLRALLPPGVGLWVGGPARVVLGRQAPAGVLLLGRAADVPALVDTWRAAQDAG